MKKLISIVLLMVMTVTTMSIGVFAADDGQSAPVAVKDLKAYSAYKSVALEWSGNGADTFDVYKNGNPNPIARDVTTKASDGSGKFAYIAKTGKEGGSADTFYVIAKRNGLSSAKSNVVSKASVNRMLYRIKFKKTRTLKSHDAGKVTTRFRKGTTLKANNFRFGKYIFDYKGHTYYVNYLSLKNFKAYYNKKTRYSNKEAEYFVNTSNVGSNTKNLIWASLYTQRLYLLTGSKGHWKVTELNYKGVKASNWGISSGMATMPSPGGFGLKIYKKARSSHGVRWWNYYHSQTSLHGKVGNQSFDRPRSGGCIRNPDKYARLMYERVPVGSRLIVY